MSATSTQQAYPGRATARTTATVSIAAVAVVAIVALAGELETRGIGGPVAMAIVILSAVLQRIMVSPVVLSLIARYVPWLSPEPSKQ